MSLMSKTQAMGGMPVRVELASKAIKNSSEYSETRYTITSTNA